MKNKKIITFYLLLLFLLTNCIQTGASLLGPSITVAKTGNIYQAGLSYSTNKIIESQTGKTTSEHIMNLSLIHI